MKTRFVFLALLLTFSVFTAALSFSHASAQSTDACQSTVVVQSGNTLSGIANEYLGSYSAYGAIAEATNAAATTDASFATINNPSQISVGWKLCIPQSGTAILPQASNNSSTESAAAAESSSEDSGAPVAEESALTVDEAQATQAASVAAAASTPSAPPDLTQFEELHPLMIESMRQQTYPGSEMVIEQTLEAGANYSRYIASYQSEGNKIFGLLTVPNGVAPESGWPVILFNHGYIPPEVYRTDQRYIAYQDAFARSGYISFKSDYRGHGFSEGAIEPDGPNSGNRHTAYTADVLNALASLKQRPDVDVNAIGMWGHSMGGQITLRAMVVSGDVKAGSIWAGTVANYATMWERWEERSRYSPDWGRRMRQWRSELVGTYGTPEENPDFWASISPNSYLTDLSGPVLLQHATGDASVPVEYSDILNAEIEAVGGDVEYFRYDGDDHNLAANLGSALARDVAFFDAVLKP